jgi:hypothetical protein
VATDWEAEVASVRAENREVRTWLREAQSQQRRAEERAWEAEQKAKEADELKVTLAAKVAALATAEEQLWQEHAARQEAEGRLQQERAALADARSALEQERTALERAQKSLEERGATVVSLQQAVKAEHRALEVEKKQVEGESPLRFLFRRFSLRGCVPLLISFACDVQACAPRWGMRPIGPRRCRPPTTPPSRNWWSCVLQPSRPARPSKRARRKLEARWPAVCAPSAGMSLGACIVRST